MATPRDIGGPVVVTRYNLYTAAAVNGAVPANFSSGEAIATVHRLADETLPRMLLSVCFDRPRRREPAKQRSEIPPPHSLTSLASLALFIGAVGLSALD